jgi:DNA-binding transcriptional regulator YdaS (Cro superfamily)
MKNKNQKSLSAKSCFFTTFPSTISRSSNNQGVMESRGIDTAIRHAGGQVALAKQLGVSQQAISIWRRQGWVPLRRVSEIEVQYGVPREELLNPAILDVVTPSSL